VQGARQLTDTVVTFSAPIVDALVDAVLIVDDLGQVIYANPALGQLLGWAPPDLFAQPFVTLVPEQWRDEYQAEFDRIFHAEPPRPSPAPRRMVLLCADGSELPVDVGTFLVAPGIGGRLLIAVVWDVRSRIDIDRYQRVSDDLLAFLAGASGSTAVLVPHLLSIVASSMDFEFAASWGWDSATERLHCEHVWRRDEDDFAALHAASTGMVVRSGQGLAGAVVDADELVWRSDLAQATDLVRHKALVSDGLQTTFAFPIRTRDRLVGIIELFTRAQRKPDAPLVEAVAEICATLGEFIERLEFEGQKTELIAQLERSQRHQEFLLRANRALAGARDFRDSVERLASVALPMLGDICLIDVVSPTGHLNRLAARHADPAYQGATDELKSHSPDIDGSHPAARAVRTGQSQWSSEIDDDFLRSTTQSDDHFALTQSLRFESYVCVPLLIHGNAIGALTVITDGTGRKFGNEELVLAESLASQVASVIERVRRFDEQSTISHLLQASLLPDHLGQLPGISVAARYVAGSQEAEVGGDFYDAVELPGGRLAFAIGDVEGHDMTAATAMGELRSALRAYLLVTQDPGAVISMLDAFVVHQPMQRLATTCLVILDTVNRTIALASAGHPLPYIAHPGASAALVAAVPGPPLGIGGGTWAVANLELTPEGTLALFTDGLIDEGRSDSPQKAEALRTLINTHQSAESGSLADAIVRGLGPSSPRGDDLALLVVRWSHIGP
jgi:PAS domain S-box-containing protein